MNRMNLIPVVLALLLMAAPRAADDVKTTTITTTQKSNIVDMLRSDARFKILVKALDDTKLSDSLRAEGPFTLFAPTDDAFKMLPNLKDTTSDATHMKALLNNHLSGKRATLADLANQPSVTMINGEVINLTNGGKMIGNAAIVVPDVSATNGVIHGIDRVLTQSVEKKKTSAVTAPPTNAYVQNQPQPLPPAEVAPQPEFRVATQERVRADGSVERTEVPVPVTPKTEPAPLTETREVVVTNPPPPVERKVLIEERVREDGTIERKEVVVEDRNSRGVSGELKGGVDKTYDGLKTGARKIKNFFTGN